MNELLLTDEAIQAAFDGDFGEVNFDHKPTPDDILLVKLKLVAKAQLAEVMNKRLKRDELIRTLDLLLRDADLNGKLHPMRREAFREELLLLYPSEEELKAEGAKGRGRRYG